MTRIIGMVAAGLAAVGLACSGGDGSSGPSGTGGSMEDGGVLRDDAGRRIDPDSGQVIPEEDGSTGGGSDGGSSGGGGSDGGGSGGGGGSHGPVCESNSIVDLPSDTSVRETFDNTGLPSEAEPTSSCAGNCADSGAPDRTFRYTPPEDGMLTISTVNPGTAERLNTILSVFDACDGGGTLLACNSNATGVASRIVRPVRGGETLYIVVDACEPSDMGNIELTVDLSVGSTSVSGSDSCDSPTPLDLVDVGSGVRAGSGSGDTSTATSYQDLTTVCGATAGPDHYYSFVLTEEEALAGRGTFRVEVTPSDGSFDPLVYVFAANECADPNRERCADRYGRGEPEILNTALVYGGTYIVAVDGVDGTSGSYDLVARLGE